MSHPSDQVMGATGTPTCAPPNLERLEVDSKILHSSTHQRSVSPIAAAAASCQCYFREGKLDLARIWDQEDQGSGNGRAILPLSLSPALLGSAVPTFQGRLEYKGPRAKCFIREKKRKKLFPSAEPKAALLIRKFLFSVLQNKVERAGMWSQACPMGKNYFKRFLYNMYRARCKPAPQIQNTQQY